VEGFTAGKLLRIFVDDDDRCGMQPLYVALVELLRKRGLAGATVFRGIEGFGSHDVIHRASAFAWMPNLPILIEVVDGEERIAAVLPELQAMIPDGLMTLEDIEFKRLARTRSASGR
jgi:PII-like signaling protein